MGREGVKGMSNLTPKQVVALERRKAAAEERYLKASSLRKGGLTFKEIGAVLGVSITRAAQMVYRGQNVERRNCEVERRLRELGLVSHGALNRRDYPELFNAVDRAYEKGEEEQDFKLPDLGTRRE